MSLIRLLSLPPGWRQALTMMFQALLTYLGRDLSFEARVLDEMAWKAMIWLGGLVHATTKQMQEVWLKVLPVVFQLDQMCEVIGLLWFAGVMERPLIMSFEVAGRWKLGTKASRTLAPIGKLR